MTGVNEEDGDGAGEGVLPSNTADYIQGTWERGGELGKGGAATVYKAFHSCGSQSAVKEIQSCPAEEKESRRLRHVSRIKEEIRCMRHLTHDHIIQFRGTQKHGDKYLIFMELAGKGSLKNVYKKDGPLVESQIKVYTRHIAEGIQHMHANNYVHLDLKCDNILVTENGTCKVGDFGCASQVHDGKMSSLSIKGSIYWSAPETLHNDTTYSFPADIWSLGCTVVEMATREHPFPEMSDSWKAYVLIGYNEGVPSIPDTLSESGKDFLRRCFQRNPEDRPTAAELLAHPFLQGVQRKGPIGTGSGMSPIEVFAHEQPPRFLFQSAHGESSNQEKPVLEASA